MGLLFGVVRKGCDFFCLEAALGVLDAFAAENADTSVEPVHQDRPEKRSLGHRFLLQMGPVKKKIPQSTLEQRYD